MTTKATRTTRATKATRAKRTRKAANSPKAGGGRPPRGLVARARGFLWRLFWRLTALGLLSGAIFLAILWNLTPDVRDISPLDRSFGIRIYAGDGRTLIGTSGALTAEPIHSDHIPENLAKAVTASEDRRFYWHPGIDPIGLTRAMYTNLRAGQLLQGGSTITQQFAKLRYIGNERSLWRKVNEAVIALKLEWHHSKNEILAAYMNEVFVGSSNNSPVYGLSGAAQRYFDTQVHDLTDYQAAVLAGIVQAPSRQNPATNEAEANRRALSVIAAMEAVGHISSAEAEAYRGQSPNLLPPEVLDANHPSISYFTEWIGEELYRQIGDILEVHGRILNQDVEVYTTLDLNLQKQTARLARDTILSRGLSANASQVAAVVMDQRGAVLALVGGTDWRANQFNRASEARRQPGSTFKLFVYLSALQSGLSPESRVLDAARSYEGWTPQNYSGETHGMVTLQEAFAKSYNLAAVNLCEAVGRDRVRTLAAEMLNMDLRDVPPGPAVALGTGEVTLLDLTAAYGAISNGGARLVPFGIEKVILEDGTEISLAKEPQRLKLAQDRQALGQAAQLLRAAVAEGTGRSAQIDAYTFGKTGTSSAFRDAWFVGFQNSPRLGNLVAGVWMGNDDGRPMDRVGGGSLPASLWRKIVSLGSPLATRLQPLPTGRESLSPKTPGSGPDFSLGQEDPDGQIF